MARAYDLPPEPGMNGEFDFRVYDDVALASRLTPPGMTLIHHAWATGENPPLGLIDERPSTPLVPFWYCVRLLRKD